MRPAYSACNFGKICLMFTMAGRDPATRRASARERNESSTAPTRGYWVTGSAAGHGDYWDPKRSDEQCPRRRYEVGSAHQAFADEEGGNAGIGEAAEIFGRRESAFGHDQNAGRN